MSSASLVFGKCEFSFVASRLHFNTWFCTIAQKLKMVNSKGIRLNSYYFSKCNYKAFNRLCCPNRLTVWNHAQIRKRSLRSKFFQRQRARHMQFSAPEERSDSRRKEGKHRIDWRGPQGAPSPLCSFTHLLRVSAK